MITSLSHATTIDFLRSRRNTKWIHYGPDVIPAWVADMDFGAAPPIQAALQRLLAEEDYGYPHRASELAERAVAAAFSRHELELYGWEPDPDLVVPLPDLTQAFLATIIAYTEPSEGVLIQLPAYPPFIAAVGDTARRLVENPMLDDGSAWSLDMEGFRRGAAEARMLLICNPQNPTGRVFTRTELGELGRVAIEHDLIIVADEVHGELTYPENRHLPMATVAPEVAARTVTITSAAKSFNIAGLRCAVMHFGSSDLYDRFRQRFPEGILGHLSVFAIDATVAAWTKGNPWLNGIRAQLTANRAQLSDYVAHHLPDIGYHEPEATYLAWLNLERLHLRPSPWEFLLQTARVATTPGLEFGPKYRDFVRLNFATDPAILKEILARATVAIEDRTP